MKLLMVIVPRNLQKALRTELLEQNFQLTRMESEGGFLRKKSDTFILGVEEHRVEEALQIIKKTCASKEQTVAAPVLTATDVAESVMASDATRITTGGATVFILGTEAFHKF